MYVNDIYERVWPAIIKSLDTYGINILDSNQEGGVITVSIGEEDSNESSMLDYLTFWKSSSKVDSFNIVLVTKQDGTIIEIQNNMFANITNTATEEVIRALYTDLR